MSIVPLPRLMLSLAIGLVVWTYFFNGIYSSPPRLADQTSQIFTVNTESDISVVGGCQTAPTCSLRDAINAANTQVGPDDIVLPSGVYTLSSRLPSITSILTLTGPLSSTTIIDGNNAYRVLQIDPDGQMVLRGVTIQHGKAVDDPGGGAITNLGVLTVQGSLIRDNTGISEGSTFNNGGGGILNWMGTLSVINSEISGNISVSNDSHNGSQGSAIYNQLGVVTIIDSSIHGNSANYSGAIHNNTGVLTLTNSLIFDNIATNGDGAGLFNSCGKIIVTNSSFLNNIAGGKGGGISVYCGEATIYHSIIEDNRANGGGGGGFYSGVGGIYSNVILKIESSIIMRNSAFSQGGGLELNGTHATLINNEITDNQTAGRGSGLYLGHSTFQFTHTTITHNNGGDGSGIYVDGCGYDPSNPYPTSTPVPNTCNSGMTLTNTILVGQTIGIFATTNMTITMEGTLWGTGVWANQTDRAGAGTILTGTLNIQGNPDFVNPEAGNYHLGSVSAAIDQGVNAGVFSDIDDDVRPQGIGFDIGADEYTINLPTPSPSSTPTATSTSPSSTPTVTSTPTATYSLSPTNRVLQTQTLSPSTPTVTHLPSLTAIAILTPMPSSTTTATPHRNSYILGLPVIIKN